jgi:hypothetical protein
VKPRNPSVKTKKMRGERISRRNGDWASREITGKETARIPTRTTARMLKWFVMANGRV